MSGAAGILALAAGAPLRADVVVLGPAKDNTIWEDATGMTANGAGQHLFCGRSGIRGGPPRIRRALIQFDVAGAIPAGSTITAVTVTMNMSKSIAFAQTCTLTRINRDWGEGASDALAEEGDGAQAVPPDATWLHTMYDTAFWPGPGGDFAAAPSASVPVNGVAFYTWGPADGLTADVQAWLDDPASNHGWVLRGNELGLSTSTRWDSREHPEPERRPTLRIEYSAPCEVDYTADGLIDFSDYLEFLVAYDGSSPTADLDKDGDVDLTDYVRFLDLYERGC
ncbi:MAG: DNRLRE domain-containing protein [Phycisphaerales bacterium]|nr:DNRLRE domain-containing protein [Phycisphaerales bacterium]